MPMHSLLLTRLPWQLLTSQSQPWLGTVGSLYVASFASRQRKPEVVCEFGHSRSTSSSSASTSSANNQHPNRSLENGPLVPGGFCKRALASSKANDVVEYKDMVNKERPPTPAHSIPGAPDRRTEVSSVSQVIFDACWRRFQEKNPLGGVHVPREVVWLNGAPGAGKGVNTSHIMKTRGLETSLCMSDLLMAHPDSSEIINSGDMLPNTVVGEVLLEALLVNSCNAPECGVLVDGFPRTSLQVDFLKMLNDKLSELHTLCANTQLEAQYPRPLFKVVMLYVDEETSITRQMLRAEQASKLNKRILDAGAGDFREERATDMSIIKCKKRYSIFKQHYAATLRLKQFFPFHLIDAMGSLMETQEAITTELRYQSLLDLGQETYQAIRHLPLASDLVQTARQQLVNRLDDHCQKHPLLFQKVIDIITAEIMPILRESGMSGQVEYVSDLRIFNDHQRSAQMLIDVFTDRGFKVSHAAEVTHVPVQVDRVSGLIKNRKETRHRFRISWDSSSVGDWQALELATRTAENAAKEPRISQSFIPPPPPRHLLESGRSTRPNNTASTNDDAYIIFGS